MKNSLSKTILTVMALTWLTASDSQAGWTKRYVYYDMTGVTVADMLYGTNLYGTIVFPDSPSEAQLIPDLTYGYYYLAESQVNLLDNYGSYTPGYIEPPETGNYTFWVCGDDETQLWLTSDPADSLNPAKKQLICSVPGWSNARDWTKFPEQQSAQIHLEKGRQYYMEVLHKEGTGGDNTGWGWTLPSGALERPMRTFYLQPKFNATDPTVVNGPFAAPFAALSQYDPSIYDGMEVMLYADINLTPPYTGVQWLRGGTPITGATQTYYRFRARMSDDQAQFSIRVNGVTYGPVTLTVYADTTPPSLVSATLAPANPTQLQLVFSEDITSASANNTANYTLNAGTVQGATLQPDNRTVHLKTSLLTPTQVYTLTINGIQDLATPANTMSTTQTNFIIAEGAITFRAWDFVRPDNLDRLRYWSHPGSTFPVYNNDMFIEEREINTSSYQWSLSPARDQFQGQMIGYLTPPETGYYKFAVSSDDHSILYLGTTHERSSKREICFYNGATGQWNTGAQVNNQQSALIWLEAGKMYYIEAVHRDGTGGDGVSVFWQTPSGPPLPTDNQNVQSATESFLIPAAHLSTYANPPVAGAISYRIWDSVPTDLASLRTWSGASSTAPSYVNNMFVDERTITTTSYGWNYIPLRDLYLGQMIGYLTAPETGNYQFGISSDDHSILYLGTTDQPSSKVEICNYNGSTGRWNMGAQNNQRSATIPLVAGRRYYIEAVYRDGTGGDGVTVAWYTPSMVANGWVWPPNPANNQAATEPYLIPAMHLSTFTTFGNVFLTTDLPASVSAAGSTQPTLSVVADGTRPFAYTWYKNGAMIPGADTASLTLPHLASADNNALIQVVVSNNFSSVTSAVATLTVTADTSKPTLASVGSLFKQVVEVRLSEPVTTASATDTGNFLLLGSAGSPVAVTSVTVDPADATHLTLQTAALPETDLMRLVVQNLVDLSAAANVMDPQTNTFRANNFDALTRINNSQAYAATAVGDKIYMTAGGSDIWNQADQCAFLHKTITGNFDYKVQGFSLPPVNQWCKMGPMARVTLDGGSRNVFNLHTPLSPAQNTYSAQVRDIDTVPTATSSSNDPGTPLNNGVQGGVPARPTLLPYPSWLRLQRVGNTIYYYYGQDGQNWTFWTWYDSSTSPDGALPATLEVGLALTSHDTSRTVDAIMASFTAVSDGALHFTLQPTNATVIEGQTVDFYSTAGGSTPHFYQWLRNATPIPDATNATLTLTRVPFAYNGSQIACRVTNPYGGSTTTSNALLTVVKDDLRPTVRYYTTPKINIVDMEVKLLFSEPMDPTTAQNKDYYQITTVPGGTSLTVLGAALDADERTVILSTAAQTPGTTYKVVVNNVTDLACCPPNAVAPNSTDYFFYAGSAPNFAQRADGFIIMEAENAQENLAAGDGDTWVLTNSPAGYSGLGAMDVDDSRGDGGTTGTAPNLYGTGAKLVYHINFTQTGPYKIWIRAGLEQNTEAGGNKDSMYVGFNHTVGTTDATDDYLIAMSSVNTDSSISGFSGAGTGWLWRSDRQTGTDPFTFTVTTPGLHRLIFWHREDGAVLDKIVIEPGGSTSTTSAPAPCTSNGGLGDPETWDFIAQPPGGPTIAISSPTANQAFPGNGTITITPTISGPSPTVLVEYFEGTNFLGDATSAPFSIDWDSVPEGVYTLTARVTDGLGYQATSAPVQVIVDSTKPFAYAVGSLHGNSIGVYFGDLFGLDQASASNPVNYTVNGGAVTVTGATLEPDLRAVMLALSAPISGDFTVGVQGVADLGFGPNVMNPVTLQSTVVTWPLNQDVGVVNLTPPPDFTNPIMPGFAQAIGTDGFYVHAGGADIWGTADGMQFVHLPRSGDFDVQVRVAGLSRPDQWAKAGIMVREDLEGDSRNHFIAATPTNGVNVITMQWRLTKATASASIAAASRPTPCPIPNAWLRVLRTGQNYEFFWGTDGLNWSSLYTTTLDYPDPVYVGLATTSHNNTPDLAYTTGAYYRDLAGLLPTDLPAMAIGLSGNDVTISWTSSQSNLQLQYTDSLSPVNWQPVSEAPVVNGDTYTVTVQLTAQPRFFRLVQP